MRELKFRAWDKHEKKLRPLQMIDFKVGCVHSGSVGNVSNYDIMQYTGLKDRNGKEIYEGDIVIMNTEFSNSQNDEADHDKTYIGEIVFIGSKGTCLKNPIWHCNISDVDGQDKFYKSIYAIRCDIIGNIHQNPELLKD